MTAVGSERPILDADRWLYQLLRWFLLVAYWFIVAGLTLLVLTWDERPVDALPWGLLPWALIPIALTTVPVAAWIERSVHHLVYGRHDDAYEILTSVDTQFADQPPEALLPALAATLSRALDLPYVGISTPERPVAASVGTPPPGAQVVRVPLGAGTLSASARRPDGKLSAEDLRLLDELARHAGAALDVLRLTDALQRSREDLVLAREEERLRIRRELHDGLGPTLAALRLQLGVLHRSVRVDPAAAERQIDELSDGLRTATGEIRRLVYGLRPPMLDEFGLIGALQNLDIPSEGLVRRVEHPEPFPPLPAAVEVALYRIAAEALHNVGRHAGATHCVVRLQVGVESVTLTVTDDGRGLPESYLAGVGHRSMHERAEELGGRVSIGSAPDGGASISATFPVHLT